MEAYWVRNANLNAGASDKYLSHVFQPTIPGIHFNSITTVMYYITGNYCRQRAKSKINTEIKEKLNNDNSYRKLYIHNTIKCIDCIQEMECQWKLPLLIHLYP